MSKAQSNNLELFKEAYAKLNIEQQKAVDTIYGPVLVIAGPGTGKTQILALRIANLLLSDAQILPQNILCMTYTDEGKKNMRDRLFKLIGAETAQHIQVHSYHSFCNEIIQQNLSQFKKEELDAISELEKIQYIKEILHAVKKGNLLYNPKNPTSNAKYLLNLFSKMKQENWTSAYLNEKIEDYIQFLQQDEESFSKKGKRKGEIKKTVLDEIERYAKALDAVKLFDAYKTKMLENHRYDFDDMIHWVIDLFETNPEILMSYQERFQYLLVDEFQDTNGSQMKLVELMTDYDPSPNVFVVGDDDQSIFRFQGASIENMKNFQEKYKNTGLKEICLKINYRSPQGILDQAKNLIEKGGGRLVDSNPDLDKNLISYKTQTTQTDFTPKLYSFHNPRYEKIYIAQEIKKLIDSGVKPKEIAVLFYDNKSCIELGEYLKKLDIYYYTKKNINLFEEPFARQLITILNYINSERSNPYSADNLLFEVLHYNFFAIPSIEIAKASMLSYQKSSEHKKTKYSFRLYLQELSEQHHPTLFDESPSDKLLSTTRLLETLIHDSYNLSLIQLLDKIIQECNIIPNLLASEDKYELLETLTAFFDFAKDECHRNPDMTIQSFVELLNIMDENDLQLPRTKLYGNENAVRLFTVHASKGREFEHVFVAGVVKEQWEKRRTPSNGIKFPPSVFETALSSKDDDELRRMMYVALTRAKKELIVSYYQFDLKEKECEKSVFLYETFGDEAEAEAIQLDNETILAFETLIHQENNDIIVEAIEKEYIEKQLLHFEMNVTALNNFLKCPLHFYYNNIIRIPSAMAENMSFGSAIHYALEKLFSIMKLEDKIFPSKEKFIDLFVYYMKRNKEKFSPEGFLQKIEYGKDILNTIYDTKVPQWYTYIDTEYRINAMLDNTIPIKGFIDKIEYYSNNEITVVDYKTGDIESTYTKEKLKKGNLEKEEIGGDYWRQAIFYKLLFDNTTLHKYNVRNAVYEFVEPNKKTHLLPEPFYFDFPKEEVDMVKNQIHQTWEKIQSHDFYTGCGKENCEWCNLTKQLKS